MSVGLVWWFVVAGFRILVCVGVVIVSNGGFCLRC